MTKPQPLASILAATFTLLLGLTQGCQADGKHETASTVAPAAKEAVKAVPQSLRVYVGTYTSAGKSLGIYMMNLDTATGTLSKPELAVESTSPSFLAISPNHKYMYAANEVDNFNGQKTGAVSAFSIDAASGKLTLLNQASSGGPGPCHVSVDKSGRNVFVANYSGGSFARFPVADAGTSGKLVDASRVIQLEPIAGEKGHENPRGHFMCTDPTNAFALGCDLGTDQVYVYHFDILKGLMADEPVMGKTPNGQGPRHLDFHPNGKWVYVINEMGSTITYFSFNPADGTLAEQQNISTLPADFKGNNSTAEIFVHPSGNFVYGSNRGHDSIALFNVDKSTGKLTAAGHTPTGGKMPRNFGIDPSGKFLIAANMGSDNLNVFKIDQATGALTPTGTETKLSQPVCVVFMPVAK